MLFLTKVVHEKHRGVTYRTPCTKSVFQAQSNDLIVLMTQMTVALPFLVSQLNSSSRRQLGWQKEELFQHCTFEGRQCDYE